MRSIEANYRKIQMRNENLGAYIVLAEIVKGKSFARKSLIKAFNELVPKDEYVICDRKDLIDYLDKLTNMPEEVEI